jgi:hypothetical protein
VGFNLTLLITQNKLIAVSPFPAKSIKPVAMKGGLIGVAQKVELTALDVVLPSDDGKFLPGMKVFVRGDLSAHDFAANTQEIDGKTFILMPESHVLLKQQIETTAIAPRPLPTSVPGPGASSSSKKDFNPKY